MKVSTPTVSVVMAAKNYAKFLPMAVESVVAQTFGDWELVIIDDGSTDDTCEVVNPYLKDARVRYHRSDRLGQSRAKNLGVRLSRGCVIAFLDADDAWRPTKLERQLPLLTGNVGVVHCARELIGEELLSLAPLSPLRGEGLGVRGGSPAELNISQGSISTIDVTARGHPSPPTPLPEAGRGEPIHRIYIANPICFSSTMVKREVFDFVGGFDPDLDLSIDYDVWLHVAKHYDFAHVDEQLVLYRTGHGNLSKKLADRIATAFTIMHRHAETVDAATRAEAHAMTCRSLAWARRPAEPRLALRSYLRALKWPHRRSESVRGILGTLKDAVRKRPRPTAAENLSANC